MRYLKPPSPFAKDDFSTDEARAARFVFGGLLYII